MDRKWGDKGDNAAWHYKYNLTVGRSPGICRRRLTRSFSDLGHAALPSEPYAARFTQDCTADSHSLDAQSHL